MQIALKTAFAPCFVKKIFLVSDVVLAKYK